MPIPKIEVREHREWVKEMRSIPARMCVIKPDNRCIRPKIRSAFISDLTLFEYKLTDQNRIHAMRPLRCVGCPIAAGPRRTFGIFPKNR